MRTSQKQISLFTGEPLTSLPGDSLANHLAQPENEREQMTAAIYGPKCLEQYAKFARATSWAKMFMACLIGRAGWYSTRCKLIWNLKGTRSSRLYFQLQALTPRTDGTAFSLLPTPRSRAAGGNCSNDRNKGNLEDIIARGLLPTPTTGANQSTQYKQGGRSLKNYMSAAGLLPTPTSQDGKNGSLPPSQQARGSIVGEILRSQPIGKTSQLNPRFVGEMMGYPPNWTILPFQSGETKV